VVLVLVDGEGWLPASFWAWVVFLGLPLSVGLLLLAVGLDREPRDLRLLWTLPLWPLYSAMMSVVVLDAVRLELRGAENRWNKLERTGTVSVEGLVDPPDGEEPPRSSP
jgi:hypothetical protein